MVKSVLIAEDHAPTRQAIWFFFSEYKRRHGSRNPWSRMKETAYENRSDFGGTGLIGSKLVNKLLTKAFQSHGSLVLAKKEQIA